MTSGIELILAAVCLNATCLPENSTQGLINETYLINLDMPLNISLEVKNKELNNIRQWLNGRHLKIATLEDYPLSYTLKKNGTLTGYGASFRLVNFLAKKFNFSYDVVLPDNNIIGANNDMMGSLLELMNKTKIDMAAAFIPVIGNTREFVYYSTTLDEGEWVMIMSRPTESANGSGLLAPFDFQVWILILVSLIVVGPVIYILLMLRRKLTGDRTQSTYSLGHCTWFVYGALMKQGSTLSPVADSSRLIFATWWIFITILTSFYTANLTAYLTLSKFNLPFNTVDDILDREKHFIAIRGGGIEYAIKMPEESLSQLNIMVKKNRAMFKKSVNDTEILINYVEKKKMVFVRDRPAMDHLVHQDYLRRKKLSHSNERVHCPFAVARTPFLKKKRAFVYPSKSKLSTLFDPELLNLVESGVVKYLLHEKLPNVEICPQDLGGTERQLRVEDLAMTYYVTVSGFATAMAVLFTEILFKFINEKLCKKRNVGHTLRGPIKNVQNALPFEINITPPPPYGSVIDSRKLIKNVKPVQEIKGVRKFINGRDYIVYKGSDGINTLVPVRAPSAALFQYSYTE